ncbi:MAG: SdpI family protein [Micrococcales bacterium]|nr:SdpI family protein [Micrococcales bacterium]MCL2667710.1 SdpI family protein [Micrococcales bacterium]
METWLIMFGSDIFLLALFFVVGLWLKKSPPPRRPKRSLIANGYVQTKMATTNDDTWDFANRDYGRRLVRVATVAFPLVVLAMVPVLGRSEEVVAYWGSAVMVALIVAFLVPIVWTERALRATFTPEGTRRDARRKQDRRA